MASVRQRKGTKFWFACITLPNKKQKQFSTGLENREEALAVAVATERAARKHHTSPHQLRTALDRIASDFVPPDEISIAAWMKSWTAQRKGEVSEASAEIYRLVTEDAAQWLASNGVAAFPALTAAKLIMLRDHWLERMSEATVNTRMQVLRVALNAAVRAKLLDRNPGAEVPKLKTKPTRRREFRPAELEILLPTLAGEWRALTMLGLYTGQRLNDLALLKWRAVDLENKTIALVTGKTQRLVVLPIVDPLLECLVALPSTENPDSPVLPAIAAMPRGSRSGAFRKLLADVGLARAPKVNSGKPKKETSELSFHSLRHTATSMLKAAGVSDAIARAIIGHESVAVSRQYTHLDLDTMRQAMEKMPVV